VEAVGTNRTVRVDLVVLWLRHLYKNGNYMLDHESIITQIVGAEYGPDTNQ
jgi:hypothetical protein